MGKRERRHSVIHELPQDIREAVEDLLLDPKVKYSDVSEYLKEMGYSLHPSNICRYAQQFHASMAALRAANETMTRTMEMMDKQPNLDATEAIVRVMGQHLFMRLATISPEEIAEMSAKDLVSQATALVRAASGKRVNDTKVKQSVDLGLEQFTGLLYDSLKRDNPELYEQLTAYMSGIGQGP
ncbi:hypothetical protein FACS1894202_14880 [Clostridia bacterium]|nr:hypothetical protein FACS1894202_14880 [Clostridia bacterium]